MIDLILTAIKKRRRIYIFGLWRTENRFESPVKYDMKEKDFHLALTYTNEKQEKERRTIKGVKECVCVKKQKKRSRGDSIFR